MSNYSRISFAGGETAGTPAYLSNAHKETAGSPAYMSYALRETAGSPAYLSKGRDTFEVCAINPSFKGYDSFEKNNNSDKKGVSPVAVGLGTVAAIALIIGGLGYAHKIDVLSKMKDGKAKEILTKVGPVARKCHEWCSVTKTKGNECLESIKKFFNTQKG